MVVDVNTEGCEGVQFELYGDIGSFDPSFLQVGFSDDNSAPLLGAGLLVEVVCSAQQPGVAASQLS